MLTRPVLDLRLGGLRWLVAESSGTVLDGATEVYLRPGLPTDLPDAEVDLLTAAEPPTILIEGVRLPGLDTLPADLPLYADLCSLRPGDTWAQRRRLLVLRAATWTRAPGERLSAELLTDTIPEDLAQFPPAEATISADTWTDPLVGTRAIDGAAYPVVFNAPGPHTISDGTAAESRATPAYPIESGLSAVFLLSDGHVAASTVTIVDPDDLTSTVSATVTLDRDLRGRPISIASVSTGIVPVSDKIYHAIWTGGAGVYGETRGGASMSAGELCLYLLRRSGVATDRARWRALLDDLSAYTLAGCVEEPVPPWSYLLDAVLPLLPLSLVMGPDGWRPVLFRHDLPPGLVRAHVSVRPGELYEPTEDTVVGQLTPTLRLRWAFDRALDLHRETATIAGDPTRRGDLPTSAYTLAAYSRWLATQDTDTDPYALREPPSRSTETDLVYDRATAYRVLHWQAAAYALPQRRIIYPCSPALLDLDLGDPVLLTDPDRGLTRAPAVVDRLPYVRRAAPSIVLRVLGHPFLPSSL